MESMYVSLECMYKNMDPTVWHQIPGQRASINLLFINLFSNINLIIYFIYRRVYIAYLDSVHFFQPRLFRTAVYHEMLIGYLDYAKRLGYSLAHIWACPPSEGDDYIFHCHPSDQRIPKPKRLQEWYKKMLDKVFIDKLKIK